MHQQTEDQPSSSIIRRKPLPLQPTGSHVNTPQSPPRTFVYNEVSELQPAPSEKTAPSDSYRNSSILRERNIIGPRSMKGHSSLIRHTPQTTPQKENLNQGGYGQTPADKAYTQKRRDLEGAYAANSRPLATPFQNLQESSCSSKATEGDSVVPLTLIRRYNGDQVNVGRIYPDDSLEIFGQGYQKWAHYSTMHDSSSNGTPIGYVNEVVEQSMSPFVCQLQLSQGFPRRQELQRPGLSDCSLNGRSKRHSLDIRRHSHQFLKETSRSSSTQSDELAATPHKYSLRIRAWHCWPLPEM